MRKWSVHRALAWILLAAPARGQEQDLAAVLARFPDDALPRLLSQLGTPQHEAAVNGLRAIGRRAHPYLLGALCNRFGVFEDLAPAFGDFGPDCTESLPVLLTLLRHPRASRSAVPLLRALGPAARPAVPLLRQLEDPVAKRLAEQLAELPLSGPFAPAAAPASAVAVVDRRWQAELLAILYNPAERARWWPALQALSAIDEPSVAEAAAVIAAHAAGNDATVSGAARELLAALRCRHVAAAMAPGEVTELPPDLLVAELRRHVLAQRLQPFDPTPAEAAAVATLCVHANREVRWLMVLHALLQTIADLPSTRSPPQPPLAAWLADPDEGVRQLARKLEIARAAAIAAAVATGHPGEPPGKQPKPWRELSQLGDDQLRQLPAEQVRELLAMLKTPEPVPPAPATGNVAEDLLRLASREASRPAENAALWTVLYRLVDADPALVRRLGELSADERRTLLAACLAKKGGAPEVHSWVLDQIELNPPGKPAYGRPLPIELLPALRARLADGRDPERTAGLWHDACAYQNWADAAAESLEALAALVPLLSPDGCRRVASVLTVTGPRGRRELERLVLDPALPGKSRAALVKYLFNNLQRMPPSGAFVVKLLEHADVELRKCGRGQAPYVRDERDAIAAILMAQWQEADAELRRILAFALGRLQVEAAVPLLAAELEQRQGKERIQLAIALLDADDTHAAAAAALTGMLDGADEELRRLAWRSISHSPGASARFLDRAVASMDKGELLEAPHAIREFRLLESATARRRDDVLQQLARLQRHRDNEVASMARQTLERLTAEQPR